jgi:hypothetical protein
MIDRTTVEQLRDDYPWASFAVWSEDFPDEGCVEDTPSEIAPFIVDHHEQLTSDVVLLGLNRSNDLPAPFSNFHAATRQHFDWRLKEFIQDGGLDRLHGAFMTDLVDESNPDAHEVVVTGSDVEDLADQVRVLDESEYHVVCFGNDPFDGLVDRFDAEVREEEPQIKTAEVTVDGLDLHLNRVWFYGAWGENKDKVPILADQLEYLNDRLIP